VWLPVRAPFITVAAMSQLSPADRRFIEGRRLRTHVGLYVVPSALAGVLALWAALFTWWPIVFNIRHAWDVYYYQGSVIPPGAAISYAITVTMLVNALMLLLCVALVFAMLWARSERRYLRLLGKLDSAPSTSVVSPTQTPEQSRT
jgi:hypothetical protein